MLSVFRLCQMTEYNSKCLIFAVCHKHDSQLLYFCVQTADRLSSTKNSRLSLYKIVTRYISLYLQKRHPKHSVETQQPKYFLITIIVVGCVTGVVLTAVAIYLMMRRQVFVLYVPSFLFTWLLHVGLRSVCVISARKQLRSNSY